MMRSIWAVVAGFLFIFVISTGTSLLVHLLAPNIFMANGGTNNVVILCLTTLYTGVFAVVGCYLAARMAPSHPMRHALILGALGLILNLSFYSRMSAMAPSWYTILNLLLVMPYAWLGGRLRENEVGIGTTATVAA